MKKAAVLCFLLAALSVGLLGGAAVRVDAAREDVTLEETILYGDPSAAKGLRVQVRYRINHERRSNLWWMLDHRPGEEPSYEALVGHQAWGDGWDIRTDFLWDKMPDRDTLNGVRTFVDCAILPDRDLVLGCANVDGQPVLMAIRKRTKEILADIRPENPSGSLITGMHYGDDHLLAVYGDDWFTVVGVDGDKYTLGFSQQTSPDTRMVDLASQNVGMAFDGERLAIVDRVSHPEADYYVAVYTADGLQFEALYTSSLRDFGIYANSHPFLDSTYDPLARAEWEGTP